MLSSVTVKKDVLLKALWENREKHHAQFIKAQEGYRDAVIKELDQMLQEAREFKPIRRSISLPEPIDHTDDYDAILKAVEMSVDDHLQLDGAEFRRYVLDQWEWSRLAMMTNSRYIVSE